MRRPIAAVLTAAATLLATTGVALALAQGPHALVYVTPQTLVELDDPESPAADLVSGLQGLGDPCDAVVGPGWCAVSTGSGETGFVADATAPGEAAYELATPATADKATVSTAVPGTKVEDVAMLGYATRTATPTAVLAVPSLVLQVQVPGEQGYATLAFDPSQIPGALQPSVWQHWDAYGASTGWFSPQVQPNGYSDFTTLRNKVAGGVVTRLAVSLGTTTPGARASADSVVLNGTTYDFELTAPGADHDVTFDQVVAQDGTACGATWCRATSDSGTVDIVTDPTAEGLAALAFATPSATSTADVRTTAYRGPLAGLDTLAYQTWRDGESTTAGHLVPALKVTVETGIPATPTATLLWEPVYAYAGEAAVVSDRWQQWVPSSHRGWWSNENRQVGGPGRADYELGSLGFVGYSATWSDVQRALPEAVVTSIGIGQSNPGLASRTDLLQVNADRYDFQEAEQSPSPQPSASSSPSPSVSSSPSASASASPSPSVSASPTGSPSPSPAVGSPSASPTGGSTGGGTTGGTSGGSTGGTSGGTSGGTTGGTSGGTSGGSTGTISTQGSPSPSASVTSTPSPSGSPAPCPTAQVLVNTPTINATGAGSVTVFGAAPGATVQLFGYSQNHYGTATYGPAPVRTAAADANGAVTFADLRPSANTRLKARQVGCAFGGSAVISVRTQLTLQVARTGTRTYVFRGDSIPAREGGLIVGIYRVTSSGETLVAQARAGARNGEWTRTLTFAAKDAGRAQFVVKTGRDAQNVPGRSNARSLLIF